MDFMSADGFGSVSIGVTSVNRPPSIMAVKAPQWELCFRWSVLDILEFSTEVNSIKAVDIIREEQYW